MTQAQQAKMLRKLADKVEAGKPLPAEVEETIAEQLEDRMDAELAEQRRGEKRFPWEQVKAELAAPRKARPSVPNGKKAPRARAAPQR